MGDDGSSSPASYIRLVQHLIEKCICYNMNKEECMVTLEKHANIKPVVTSTVWKELEKENQEFFETYMKDRGEEWTTQKNPPPEHEQAAATKTEDADEGAGDEGEQGVVPDVQEGPGRRVTRKNNPPPEVHEEAAATKTSDDEDDLHEDDVEDEDDED